MAEETVEEVKSTEETETPKPRRKRRTKAQIEAEKALEENKSEEVKNDKTSTDNSNIEQVDNIESELVYRCNPTEVVEEIQETVETVEEQTQEPVESIQEPVEDVKSDQEQSQEIVADSTNQTTPDQLKGTFHVYEVPIEGSYAKKLFGIFKFLCTVDDFVQVEYMRHGFGMVKGYIKKSQFHN